MAGGEEGTPGPLMLIVAGWLTRLCGITVVTTKPIHPASGTNISHCVVVRQIWRAVSRVTVTATAAGGDRSHFKFNTRKIKIMWALKEYL